MTRKLSPGTLLLATLLACSCSFDLGSLQGGPTDAGSEDAGNRPGTGGADATSPDSGPPQGGTTEAGRGDSGSRPGATEAGAASPDTLPPSQCPPRSTGGLPCPGGKCSVGTYGGTSFASSDQSSTVCLSTGSLCAAGTTNSLASTDTSSNWGATFGFYLSPDSTPYGHSGVQLTGSGMAATLSNLPTGAQVSVQVTVGGTTYCSPVTALSQEHPWTSFSTRCWDDSGTFLTGAPADAKSVAVQVGSEAGVAGTFDLCVTTLTL